MNWKRKIKTSPGNRICIIPHVLAWPIVHSVLPWRRTVPLVSHWPPTVSWPVPRRTRRPVPTVYGPWADRQYSTHPSVQSRQGLRTARTERPLSLTEHKINSIRLNYIIDKFFHFFNTVQSLASLSSTVNKINIWHFCFFFR